MAKRLIYTVTTGRSGTVFLTELFRDNLAAEQASIFHERVGFPNFGVHSPDASHFTTFNAIGNAPNVQAFFQRKLELDLDDEKPNYIEVSHFLCKAGLVENLPVIADKAEVHLIGLQRDPFKIAWSFINRFDFFNTGFTWLFSLDPRYRNVIVSSEPFRAFGMFGSAIWYVAEMAARTAYYDELVAAGLPSVSWHSVSLEEIVRPEGASALLQDLGLQGDSVVMPPKKNETKQEFFGEKEKALVEKILSDHWGDPAEQGRKFYREGKRLSGEFGDAGSSPKTGGVHVSVSKNVAK